jgi:hypothetical protein
VEFQAKRISLARGNRREFKTIAAILTSAYASLSIEELTEKFPRFRVAFLLAELLAIQRERSPRLEREDCRRGGRMSPALGRDGTVGNPRSRRLARGVQGLRHQTHELSLVRRAAHQAGARRRAAAQNQRAR